MRVIAVVVVVAWQPSPVAPQGARASRSLGVRGLPSPDRRQRRVRSSHSTAWSLNGHSDGRRRHLEAATFPAGLMYRTAFELTYGLTDKLEAAAYLNLAQPDGASFQYAGSKYPPPGQPLRPGEYLSTSAGTSSSSGTRRRSSTTPRSSSRCVRSSRRISDASRSSPHPIFEKALRRVPTRAGASSSAIPPASTTTTGARRRPASSSTAASASCRQRSADEQQHYVFPVVRGELPGDSSTTSASASG